MLNFVILIIAMCASGAIGFYLARDRYMGQSNKQLHVLGSEIQRMHRRARDAEAQAARITTERDRLKRTPARR